MVLVGVAVAGLAVLVAVNPPHARSAAPATAAVRPAPHPAPAPDTVPPDPVTNYTANVEFFERDGLGQYAGARNTNPPGSYAGYFTSGYWVEVPPSYRTDNRTPEALMVWLHGCEGTAKWDDQVLSSVYDANRPYIVMSISGAENAGVDPGDPNCWDATHTRDVNKVLTDIRSIESHFNIDRRHVYIGGYSSGGDLAWQTIFTHADTFAGILAINTNPVMGNTFGVKWGLNGIDHAIAGAAWKFHVVQVSHAGDDIYHVDRCGYPGYERCPSGDRSGTTNPDPGVTPAIHALQAAGFPVDYRILPGQHGDPDLPKGCEDVRPATCTRGTYADVVHYLMPHVRALNWEAPAP
jgi:hypothetical protein